MLIKIAENTFINSDHLESIAPAPDPPEAVFEDSTNSDQFVLRMSGGSYYVVSEAVVIYITEILDADTGLTAQQPTALALSSRIAIYLKDMSTGLTAADLLTAFPGESENDITAATAELLTTNVLKALSITDREYIYYHASNPIFAASDEDGESGGW